ncbi:MAG: hypothetical protein ACXW2E_01585 [Nitrososphaeraceae archaeon]
MHKILVFIILYFSVIANGIGSTYVDPIPDLDPCDNSSCERELSQAIKTIDVFIDRLVNSKSFDDIFCTVVKSHINPLSNNSVVQLVTLIGCAGGNHYESYLILATNNKNWIITDMILIGSDKDFSVEKLIVINKKRLLLNGRRWSYTDPHCCPSIKSYKKISIENNKFVTD